MLGWEKPIVLIELSIKNFKKHEIYIWDKTFLLSSLCNKCSSEDEKVFKKEESIEIFKTLGLETQL